MLFSKYSISSRIFDIDLWEFRSLSKSVSAIWYGNINHNFSPLQASKMSKTSELPGQRATPLDPHMASEISECPPTIWDAQQKIFGDVNKYQLILSHFSSLSTLKTQSFQGFAPGLQPGLYPWTSHGPLSGPLDPRR